MSPYPQAVLFQLALAKIFTWSAIMMLVGGAFLVAIITFTVVLVRYFLSDDLDDPDPADHTTLL